MTDNITTKIKNLKKSSISSNILEKRKIINEFLEKDLDIILIDSNYIDYYDKKTKDIIKKDGIEVENYYLLEKNLFLITLKALKKSPSLPNI